MVCWWRKFCFWCFISKFLSPQWITNTINITIFTRTSAIIWFKNQSTSQRNYFLALQNQPVKEQWLKRQTRSKLSRETNSLPTSNPSEFQGPTLLPSPEPPNREFPEHSLKQSENVDFVFNKTALLDLNQLDPPWIMWQRPTNWPKDPTPDWTPMASLHSFYNAN